ncbi:phosphatidylserine/phosphatidylglycerophosphate/cardiolipin synthase family protein [bacterium]|nr:phosphatidylserine/phosphatidylglycerophosphate/cardiolipin synthase family protein [bacterium]
MLKNVRSILAILFLIGLIGFPISAEENLTAAYHRYVGVFQKYQEAVNQGKSENEVRILLRNYKEAKSSYEGLLNANSAPKNGGVPPEDQSFAQAPSIESADNDKKALVSSESKLPPIPTELRVIIEDLWDERGRKFPDAAMGRLQKFIDSNPSSPAVSQAKYELARAYEWLKGDLKKSVEILGSLAKDSRNSRFSRLAQDRLRYLEASFEVERQRAFLEQKNGNMASSYGKYRATSWLAFPVKLTRFVVYAGKSLSFFHSKAKFQEFLLKFEEISSRFTPPPDLVFDLFKVAAGKNDSESRVRLLTSNPESWYARWWILNEAKVSIDIQYFIVETDIFGLSMLGVLLKKAQEGVKIRLMVDARGTKTLTRRVLAQDFLQELSDYPNVEIKVFNPIHQSLSTVLLNLTEIMASNHDKIVVVDNEYSIIGGRNISASYFVDPRDEPTMYRDTDVLIESQEVAKQLDLAFSEEFLPLKSLKIVKDVIGKLVSKRSEMEIAYEAMNTYLHGGALYNPLKGDSKALKALKGYNSELSKYKHLVDYAGYEPFRDSFYCPLKIIDKHSQWGSRNDITDQIIRFIDGSKSEIIIQNPYVVLTDRAEAALKRASKRGIKIIFHTNSPMSTDSLLTQAMFYNDWKRILKEIPTSEIWAFAVKRKLHSKTFVFDKVISVVGTYNMDSMSETINGEVVAAIKSKGFSADNRNRIMNDLLEAKQYKIEILPNGEVKGVFGPDDLPGNKQFLLHLLAKLRFLRPII